MAFKMRGFSGFKQAATKGTSTKEEEEEFSPRFHGLSEERIAEIKEKENLRKSKEKTGRTVEDTMAERPKESLLQSGGPFQKYWEIYSYPLKPKQNGNP